MRKHSTNALIGFATTIAAATGITKPCWPKAATAGAGRVRRMTARESVKRNLASVERPSACSRRQFLGGASAGAALLACGGLIPGKLVQAAEAETAPAARPRLGCLSWNFHPLSRGADPESAIDTIGQLGFDVEQLLIINTRSRVIPGSDSLWALEQALKSGHVGAVLAWLPPRLRAERLRRLQLAAHAHDGPAFVLREMSAALRPTAAPLRLALRASGADVLAVRVLKRRGPPLEAPLTLELPPVLGETARQRAAAEPLPAALHAATFVNLAA